MLAVALSRAPHRLGSISLSAGWQEGAFPVAPAYVFPWHIPPPTALPCPALRPAWPPPTDPPPPPSSSQEVESPIDAVAERRKSADLSAIAALPPVPDLGDVLLQLRAISTLYADQVEGATATLRHKSLAADAEQRGIAKKMQAKTFAAYPNVDRPQVAIRMLAGGP